MRAVIFANGVMNHWPAGFELSTQSDLIIAADGGLNHCKKWSILPHVIVGDMDSLSHETLAAHEKQGVEIIQYPVAKNETDLELALQTAVDRNAAEIIILGALGERWDMTISNLLILAVPILSRCKAKILDDNIEIFCLKGKEKRTLKGQSGDAMSLIPIAGSVIGVTLKGFEYPLKKETLPMGTTRGISNTFIDEAVEITIEQGSALVVIQRRNL